MHYRDPLTFLALASAVACGSRTPEYRLTPADWSSSAASEPPCSTAQQQGQLVSYDLPNSVGQIALPATLIPRPTSRPSLQEYLSSDSTRVQVWTSTEPSGGMMASTRLKVRGEPGCRITVGGHFALVYRFQTLDSTMRPVRYGAIALAYPLEGVAINVLIESPMASGRDALLGAVSNLRVHEIVR